MEDVVIAAIEAMRQVVREYRVTADEYRAAVTWLSEAGKQDYLAGVLEHLLEPAVAEVGASPAARPQNPEGPYYVPGAPAMDSPCALPGAEQQPGTPLLFTGRVRSTDGSVVPHVVVDVWTVRPGAYPLSTAGLVLDLVRAMGRSEHRPAHVHVKIAHPGFRALTTQVYFPGDPHDETELLGERPSALLAELREEGGIACAAIELVLDPTPAGSAA